MASSPSSSEAALDEEQLAAAHAEDTAIAVLAGPGSGKTRTLSFRTRHLLERDPGASALLLTFTNKAAAEMKARALGVTALPGERIHASTFHTFCAEVLRSHGDLVGVSRDFEILDQEETEELAQTVATSLGQPNLLHEWSSAQLRRAPVDDDVRKFGAAFVAAKAERRILDFDGLVVSVAHLFESRPDVARAYGAKYRHILIDEFQDTNAVQFAIVSSLSAHSSTVSIFADDDQAIFGFAGAEADNIKHFSAQLNAEEYPLTRNYRSGADIVKLANKLIDSDPDSSGRRMRAHRPGGTTRVLSFASPDQEAAALASEITAAIAAGTLASDIAVLVRSGYRADAVMQALRTAAVPVSDWRNATHEPQDRRALAACLSVVRGTLNPRQLQRLTALMGVPESTEQRTDAFLASVPKHPLAAGLREVRRLAFEGASAHAVASAAQAAVAAHKPALGASMVDIVNAVAHFEAHDKQFSLEHLLSELALGSIGRSPTLGGGVKLASLHKTKGLQWKQVYLVGLEEGHHPHYKAVKDPQRLSEERRLCFVGVSRAEDSLTVTWSVSWKTWKKDRSRFIQEMGL